ncbi:MAG: glycoside hydrolase family 2 protein [Lapillicoccus sp.]
MRSTLTQPWTLTATGGAVPAALAGVTIDTVVPGCVHTDLLAAQRIPDPYLDVNEAQLTWIGRTSWRYAMRLTEPPPAPGERVELVFEGLDTVCEVRLDGRLLGSARNMHRTYRFDVTSLLRAEGNDLVVDFAGQLDAAEAMSIEQGPRVHTNDHPFNAIRKMACNFGWDWGPDLVTAGIWRPVRVERWHTARLANLRMLVTVSQLDGRANGRVEIHTDVVRAPGVGAAGLTLTLAVEGAPPVSVPVTNGSPVLTVDVPDVDLWWPRGHGAQPLRDVVVSLTAGTEDTRDDADAKGSRIELDRHERRVGFRSVTLDTTPDAHGTPFTLVVNDKPIFIKGANWIPDDCFPSAIDRDRYARSVGDAVDAGMNLLRVWGGGIYESDDFYDVCDEVGLLVWQDFLFACAAYAEEPPLAAEVVAEAQENIIRLSAHPSLAIWNGNNENLWGHEEWGWKAELGDDTWGRGYYLEVLPALVARLDPTRPYSPGSPWSFDESRHPNDPAHGTMHIWDVWNERDYTAYRSYVPRFVSEFGYQGPPAWSTLQRAIHDDPITPTSAGMANHQKAIGGDSKLTRGIAPHFDLPTQFEDWHWATQLQQARAVSYGVEHFRSWQPVCQGVVVWQLNDCWPVTSWAAVDGDGRRKPLWFALRHAYADRLLTIQPRESGLVLAVSNDTDTRWLTRASLCRMRFDGGNKAVTTIAVDVPPRSTVILPLARALSAGAGATTEVLLAEADELRALWFFDEDLRLDLVDSWKTTSAERSADGYTVHVTAEGLQRDVCLLVDKIDPSATVDDQLVTLLPGESHTFQVRSAAMADPAAFLAPRVLRSGNQLVRR